MRAEGFGLKGPRGWAFRGVGVDAAPGSLVALAGPSGSGRTCLLLALTGRMKASEGHADVGGVRLPRKMAAVRKISALAHVPGVSELDPAFTVVEHLREAALLRRRFGGSPLALFRPRAERAAENRRRVEAALEAVALDPETLPKGERTSVRDLERLEALRLSVALALLSEPRLLAVDDADLKLGDADEAAAWAMLRSVADSGVTVLAVCTETPREADVVVRTDGSAQAAAGGTAAGPGRTPEGPGAGRPEATGPAASGPGAGRPVAESPGAGRTEAESPEATGPAASGPGAGRPVAESPGAGRTEAESPEATGPAASDPGAGRTEAQGGPGAATGADEAPAEGRARDEDTPGEETGKDAGKDTDDNEEGAADAFAETGRA